MMTDRHLTADDIRIVADVLEESYLDMEEEEMVFAEATLLIHTGRRR